MAKSLRFNKEGQFTIAQFTDIHWKDGGEKDLLSRALMEHVLHLEKPDLVVFTGDVIYTGHVSAGEAECTDPAKALLEAVDTVESLGIPWAYTFGNHDAEPESPATKEDLLQAILGTKHTLTPPASVQGPGTYKLEVLGVDSQVSAVLFLLDSGNRSPLPGMPGYAWVSRDQIRWFEQESLALPRLADGKPVPACAFFHIPLPEYREMWETQVCYGYRHEAVCCPTVNSGLFAAMAELGHILGAFVGHDHVNDYWGELHGIRLCYGRASGHNTYGREGFPRGARMILLYEGERRLDTWLRLEDGTRVSEQPRHEPERPVD
ncbi:MAG: metallophosphoesterase [Paenibacillaceae bacterium]|nr:metallophosphoesterase [Paenibacillaceae bacterium]